MGVKFNREYNDIIRDIVRAMSTMEDCHSILEMEETEWGVLTDQEKSDYLQTLADDIFYGLGTERVIEMGNGMFEYDASKHTITLSSGKQVVHLIQLI